MKQCTKCVLPETHETIQFDDEGVCNICRQAEVKHAEIDWTARYEMLLKTIDKYRNKGTYDCIIPFSGGKEEFYSIVKEHSIKGYCFDESSVEAGEPLPDMEQWDTVV